MSEKPTQAEVERLIAPVGVVIGPSDQYPHQRLYSTREILAHEVGYLLYAVPAESAIAPPEPDRVVLDLAMMMRLMMRKLSLANRNDPLVRRASVLLKKHDLQGSPLRDDAAAPAIAQPERKMNPAGSGTCNKDVCRWPQCECPVDAFPAQTAQIRVCRDGVECKHWCNQSLLCWRLDLQPSAIAPDALTDAELDKLVKNLEEMETEDVQGYAAVVLGQQMGLAAEAITDLRAEIAALRGGK